MGFSAHPPLPASVSDCHALDPSPSHDGTPSLGARPRRRLSEAVGGGRALALTLALPLPKPRPRAPPGRPTCSEKPPRCSPPLPRPSSFHTNRVHPLLAGPPLGSFRRRCRLPPPATLPLAHTRDERVPPGGPIRPNPGERPRQGFFRSVGGLVRTRRPPPPGPSRMRATCLSRPLAGAAAAHPREDGRRATNFASLVRPWTRRAAAKESKRAAGAWPPRHATSPLPWSPPPPRVQTMQDPQRGAPERKRHQWCGCPAAHHAGGRGASPPAPAPSPPHPSPALNSLLLTTDSVRWAPLSSLLPPPPSTAACGPWQGQAAGTPTHIHPPAAVWPRAGVAGAAAIQGSRPADGLLATRSAVGAAPPHAGHARRGGRGSGEGGAGGPTPPSFASGTRPPRLRVPCALPLLALGPPPLTRPCRPCWQGW